MRSLSRTVASPETSEPPIVKGGRHKASLTMPNLALARQQALAEDCTDMTKEEWKLDEVAMVLDQHRFDIFGVIEENGRPSG